MIVNLLLPLQNIVDNCRGLVRELSIFQGFLENVAMLEREERPLLRQALVERH